MRHRPFFKRWSLFVPLVLTLHAQQAFLTVPNQGTTTPPAVVTELADTFVIGADAALSTHATTTGGYAWARAASGGLINDISATSKATETIAFNQYNVAHTMSSANYTATITVAYPNNVDAVDACLAIRSGGEAQGSATCYFVEWLPANTLLRLWKSSAGTLTQLGSSLTQAGTSHVIVLKASGTTISATSDGTTIASVTDGVIAGPGFVGIGSGFANLNNGAQGGNAVTYSALSVTVP